MLKRWLIGVGVALVVLLAVALLLFEFGSMWPPSAEVRAGYGVEVAAGRQPELQARFTIPVPGCVCHADDPVLQLQHSTRHMGECGNCHSRG